MKPISNVKQRPHGRGGSSNGSNGGGGLNKRHIPSRNQTYDSNGPEVRIRGNAHQVLEKYLSLARDATSQGDRVAAENYFQHAEHYLRLINNHIYFVGRQQQRSEENNSNADADGEARLDAEEREYLRGNVDDVENGDSIVG